MISDWIKKELDGIEFGDKRLNKRILALLNNASKQPQASINRMFHTRKEVQACYRFFSNDLVNESKIMAPHSKMTVERSNQYPVVLCLSDTTSLNYTTRKTLKDSGYISSNNAQGFFFHTTIAVTPDRLHLGIVGQKFWAREKQKTNRSSRQRDTMMFDEKESYRWLEAYRDSCEFAQQCSNTQVVHITDREGDIFEIFDEYQRRNRIVDYVIRSNHNRTVYHKNKSSNKLIQVLEESKPIGEISFEIIKREDNKTRRVTQSIQAMNVEIKSRYGADTPNLTTTVNAIYLKEIDPPEGEKPIVWCLLTSLPIDSFEEIVKVLSYYLCRWEIEVFFKTFKSGCKVEEKSLRSAERLYPLFSLLLIVAWRVNFLMHMGRIVPEISCESFFDVSEWQAGYMAATRNKSPPVSVPTLNEMMGYIARLGGHLGRKKDVSPGVKAIWIGICKLTNYADAWDLFGPGAAK
jgi:Transposase Tn5 dimerisation domain/Transposase DNA-binding